MADKMGPHLGAWFLSRARPRGEENLPFVLPLSAQEVQQDYEALCLGTYDLRDKWTTCPIANCAGVLQQHHSRRRSCFLPDRDHIVVNQFRCNRCSGFVTFLPPFVAPGKLYPAGTIRAAVKARHEGIAVGHIRLSPANPDRLPDARTIRRWQREFPRADALPPIPRVAIVAGERSGKVCRSQQTRVHRTRTGFVRSPGVGLGSTAASSTPESWPP